VVAVAITIDSTYSAYPQGNGQVEFAWEAG